MTLREFDSPPFQKQNSTFVEGNLREDIITDNSPELMRKQLSISLFCYGFKQKKSSSLLLKLMALLIFGKMLFAASIQSEVF